MAASVAGLASLTLEVSRTINSYCKAVKDARKDLETVDQELAILRDILHQLDQLLRSQRMKSKFFDSCSVLATSLDLCINCIVKVSSMLQSLESGGLARVWERMKWPFSEREMQKTLTTLRRCTATFQFSLTIEGW